MVGSAIGDAIGELAFQYTEKELIRSRLERVSELRYTDDTAMAIGLAESIIEEHGIDRVIFYSLNPHECTPYAQEPQPASLYYAGVVAATRIRFPDLEIITGTWIDNLANIGPLILAGANGLTKFPLFSMFGTGKGRRVEEEVRWSGRKLKGTFTDADSLMGPSYRRDLEPFVKRYIKRCLNNKSRNED